MENSENRIEDRAVLFGDKNLKMGFYKKYEDDENGSEFIFGGNALLNSNVNLISNGEFYEKRESAKNIPEKKLREQDKFEVVKDDDEASYDTEKYIGTDFEGKKIKSVFELWRELSESKACVSEFLDLMKNGSKRYDECEKNIVDVVVEDGELLIRYDDKTSYPAGRVIANGNDERKLYKSAVEDYLGNLVLIGSDGSTERVGRLGVSRDREQSLLIDADVDMNGKTVIKTADGSIIALGIEDFTGKTVSDVIETKGGKILLVYSDGSTRELEQNPIISNDIIFKVSEPITDKEIFNENSEENLVQENLKSSNEPTVLNGSSAGLFGEGAMLFGSSFMIK